MLTVSPLTSASDALKYYSHGDYYGSEGEGEWYGDGAKKLGLTGEFNAAQDKRFKTVLEGKISEDAPLGRMKDGKLEHRPGIDMTFGAPKSFSIEVNLNCDEDTKVMLREAKAKAVKTTLDYALEKGYIQIRKGKGGEIKEKVKNGIFALFSHTTNRNLEPHEHIHTLVANAAICEDGKIRSLDFGMLKPGSNIIKLLGQVERNELKREITKLDLGYQFRDVILKDGSHSFELSHIPEKLIRAFSTRTKDIEELYEKYNVTTAKGRDNITINSRAAKQKVKKEDLYSCWNNIAKEILGKEHSLDKEKPVSNTKKVVRGIDYNSGLKDNSEGLISNFKTESNDLNEEKITISELAKKCIEDASHKNSTFTHETLAKSILKYSLSLPKSPSINEVEKEINLQIQNGNLIKVGNLYTTTDLLQKEKMILKTAKLNLGKAKELLKEKYITKEINKYEIRNKKNDKFHKFNYSQKAALKYILSSKDNIIAMQGLAGVGKSSILKAVKDISGRKIISILGFGEKYKGAAPTASAAKTLETSSAIKSQTLHSFLYKYKGYIEGRGTKESLRALRKIYSKTVIVVDEASLISTNLMSDLTTLREKLNFRLILSGDKSQSGAVEAGKDFEQILKIIPSIKLDKIIRQKNIEHREAVATSSKGEVEKSFSVYDKKIESVGKRIISNVVKKYMELSDENKNKTLLISPTKKVRDKINNKIVKKLSKDKKLGTENYNMQSLRQKDFSLADYNFAKMYSKGDVIKFHNNHKCGIKKGEYYEVKKSNSLGNNLLLIKDGKEIIFKIKTDTKYNDKLEVFEKRDLQLKQGVKIRFTKNNYKHGLINSETAIIDKINNRNITLKLDDGSKKEVIKSELKHIDYGYCSTVHSAQGKTYSKTIAAINDNKMLSNQKLWTVIISRHKNDFTAIVHDKNKLKGYIMTNDGKQMSAIDLVSKDYDKATYNKEKNIVQPLKQREQAQITL